MPLMVFRIQVFNNIFLAVTRQQHTLQRKQNILRNPTFPTAIPRNYTMSTRRSARLSAAPSLANGELKVTEPQLPSKNAPTKTKRKNAPKETESPSNDDVDLPSTPKRKRVTKILPPVTPTPSAIGLMSSPYQNGTMGPPPALNRLAAPGGTNAALVTPETHRVVASKPIDQISPSKTPNIKTTTANILDEALAHLIKTEPKLKPIIEKHACGVFSPEGLAEEIDPFNSLISGIISQQVRCLASQIAGYH